MDSGTWIVPADEASARIYQADPREWKLVAQLAHPQGRAKESALGRDRPGRVKQSAGVPRRDGAVHPAKKVEMEKFAREIAKTLDEAWVAKAYQHLVLVLVAAPAFVGLLRETLPERVRRRIATVVEKDYLEPLEIRERLQRQLEAT